VRFKSTDLALMVPTGFAVYLLGGLAIGRIVAASLSGGDFPRTSPGEWAMALTVATAALALPVLVIWFAWQHQFWITVAVQAVLFLILFALALWWALALLWP
jgi:hypothetical protein